MHARYCFPCFPIQSQSPRVNGLLLIVYRKVRNPLWLWYSEECAVMALDILAYSWAYVRFIQYLRTLTKLISPLGLWLQWQPPYNYSLSCRVTMCGPLVDVPLEAVSNSRSPPWVLSTPFMQKEALSYRTGVWCAEVNGPSSRDEGSTERKLMLGYYF
jgi:hypothetical protein